MFNPTNTWSRSPTSNRLVRKIETPTINFTPSTSTSNFTTSTPRNSPGTSPSTAPRSLNLLATSPITLVKRLAEKTDSHIIIDSTVRGEGKIIVGDILEHSEEEEILREATFGHLNNFADVSIEGQLLQHSGETTFHDLDTNSSD